MTKNYKKILAEVLKAYADCGDMPWEQAEKIRNLSFRASAPVSRDEAISIFTAAVPSYNEFAPGLLIHLPIDSEVTIAREGSVCVYVKSAEQKFSSLHKKLLADEFDYSNGEWRLWWD